MLFGSHSRPGIEAPLDQAQIEHHKNAALDLKKAYRLASEARSGCKVIPVADASEDHCIGLQEPWVNGFSIGMLLFKKALYHPNVHGMDAVADILYEELKANDEVL